MSGIGKSYFSINYASNGSILDNNNKELITFDVNSGATNNLQITNNSTGSNVSIDVIGDDTDIGLNLNPKGHGKVNILGSASNTGGIRFYGIGDNKEATNHVGLTVSASLDEDITFTLPTSDGTSGQVIQTDGSGALSFTTVSGGGTPEGSDTYIQFNEGGSSFGASSNLIWDDINIKLGNGNGIAFVNDTEKISGSGTDLTIDSANDINLTAIGSVVIPDTIPLEFGSANENIVSGSSSLTINSAANINLTAGSNYDVKIPSNRGLIFGDDGEKIEGNGTDLTVTSSNLLNLTPGSASNVVITQGTFCVSTETVTNSGLSVSSGSPTPKVVSTSVTLFDLGANNDYFVSYNAQTGNVAGQLWHVFFDNNDATLATIRVDFGANKLASGSGLAQYLTFNTNGQSASLIYMGDAWRIINTGAVVT